MRLRKFGFLFFTVIGAGIIFSAIAQESGPENKVKVLREAANGLAQLRPDLSKALNAYADEEAAKSGVQSNIPKTQSMVSEPKTQVGHESVSKAQPVKAKGQPGIYFRSTPYRSELYVDDKYCGDAGQYQNQFSPLYLNPGEHKVKLKSPDSETLFDETVTLEKDGGPVALR